MDGFVIEDDYDAEFRYDHHPVPIVQGMDPGRVFLVGSVSKTVSPARGLGWLVALAVRTLVLPAADPVPSPPHRCSTTSRSPLSSNAGDTTPTCVVRRRFRARRDLLGRTLAAAVPDCRAAGTAAGLHILLDLFDGADTHETVRPHAAGLRREALRSSVPPRPADGAAC